MNKIYIRDLIIGEGRPKICVPICGKNQEEILGEAEKIHELPADVVEWRADWYDDIFDVASLQKILEALRGILGEKPILFTFRSIQEGGEKAVRPEQYFAMNLAACESGYADAVDVELFMDKKVKKSIIDVAHRYEKTVIASNHDFIKTPDKDEIIRRLILMDEMDADILKIAVMPKKKSDVLELLGATEEMERLYTEKPLVTMSMGPLGLISRLSGETFGSAMTFGAGEKVSAPGQMPAKQLKLVLDAIHENME
ncbi:MAG: type I 3-dehydroquinate dehydratase [Clostridia bacterium]|nr:type I 3-dehydroquinate dehydratase [Lachnospiraceae bacterium]NCC00289.1 type I 3-dehydroquinate dehydratase [Clostridia bacterium]NCD02313.1 type I 3-dehydroquinate dehydratase [Clostridia bacterium]